MKLKGRVCAVLTSSYLFKLGPNIFVALAGVFAQLYGTVGHCVHRELGTFPVQLLIAVVSSIFIAFLMVTPGLEPRRALSLFGLFGPSGAGSRSPPTNTFFNTSNCVILSQFSQFPFHAPEEFLAHEAPPPLVQVYLAVLSKYPVSVVEPLYSSVM